MPQLPSGRHVAVSGRQFVADGGTWDDLDHVHTLEDLAPYIGIELFREATPFDKTRRSTRPKPVVQSHGLPDDLIPYDSGYTLADFDELLAEWSDDDATALREFIDSDRFQGYLRDILRQIQVGTGQVEPTVVDVVKFFPELYKNDSE